MAARSPFFIRASGVCIYAFISNHTYHVQYETKHFKRDKPEMESFVIIVIIVMIAVGFGNN